MKVRVTTLPEAGLRLEHEFPVDSLNQRMQEGRQNDISFEGTVRINLLIEPVVGGITVKGRIDSQVRQPCARCAEEVSHAVTTPVDHIFRHFESGSDPKPEDDIGISYFEGEHVELSNLVEESLVLSLSPYWQPEQDENEICKLCKKKPETFQEITPKGIKLGALLKKAGIN